MDGQLGRIFRFVDALQSILPMRPVGGTFVELVFATALEGLEVRKTKATDGIICLFVLVQRQQMREHQLLCLSLYFARQAGACGRQPGAGHQAVQYFVETGGIAARFERYHAVGALGIK